MIDVSKLIQPKSMTRHDKEKLCMNRKFSNARDIMPYWHNTKMNHTVSIQLEKMVTKGKYLQ